MIATHNAVNAFLSLKINLATEARSVGKSCDSDVPGIPPGSSELGIRRNLNFLKFITFSLAYFRRKADRMMFRRFTRETLGSFISL